MFQWVVGLGILSAVYGLLHVRRRKERERMALEKKHQDELLDEALRESFPASDPPALSVPQR